MFEVYSLVKTKKNPVVNIVSILLFAAALGMVVYSLLTARLTFFITFIIVIALWYFLTFKYTVEYEVAYFDGEFRFTKIKNMSRRKKMAVFTSDEMMQLAPSEDRSVSNYLRDGNVRKVNMTSRTGAPYYVLVRRNAEQTIAYMVELDEKFLDEVFKKNPSKVIK